MCFLFSLRNRISLNCACVGCAETSFSGCRSVETCSVNRISVGCINPDISQGPINATSSLSTDSAAKTLGVQVPALHVSSQHFWKHLEISSISSSPSTPPYPPTPTIRITASPRASVLNSHSLGTEQFVPGEETVRA